MSVIDKVKELLAKAIPGPWKVNWGTDLDLPDVLSLHLLDVDNSDYSTNFSTAQLAALARDFALALVESQEALGLLLERIDEGHLVATENTAARQSEGEARDALRLDRLAKAMKQESPRS